MRRAKPIRLRVRFMSIHPFQIAFTQAVAFGFKIGEISCPTKYMTQASSIPFKRAIKYGLGVLGTSLLYPLWKWGLCKTRLFNPRPTLRLEQDYYRPAGLSSPGDGKTAAALAAQAASFEHMPGSEAAFAVR